MKTRKRFLSLALVLVMVLSLASEPAFAGSGTEPAAENGVLELTPEHEASLASLLSQIDSTGIDVYAAASTEPSETPSGIDPRTSVSYEIVTPGGAGYETPQAAVIRFRLENPNEEPVSFDYEIISGSASTGRLIENEQPLQGTVSFGESETEKEITIGIAPLVHNPAEYGTISDPEEYWAGDRAFFLYCSDIKNALFLGDRESMTVPVPIENNFDYEQIYHTAADTYLFDLSDLSGVLDFPEAPGKYQNTGDEINISVPVEGDIRTMVDMGVFTHIDLPAGYISNENAAVGEILYRVCRTGILGDDTTITEPVLDETLPLAGESEIAFGGKRELSEVRLGPAFEGNLMIRSLDFTLDYSSVTNAVYTWFGDTEGNFPQNQVHFTDETAPYVKQIDIPVTFMSGGVRLGDIVPVVVRYNEPVYTGDISARIGGETLYPVERAGTVSESVTFLYETDENLTGIYGGSVSVTNINGASDLSGKRQEEAADTSVSINVAFDTEKAFAYCAQPSVTIDQGESLQAKGTITISLKSYMALSNWLSDYVDTTDNRVSVVKARVIGSEGDPVDIPLYAHIEGGRITDLTGEFTAPVNQTGQDKRYAAEIYLDKNASGVFELIYGLTEEYTVQAIIFIDDAGDLEIVYTNWPPADTIFADSTAPLSLGYVVNVNATWQRSEDFSWSSSNEAIATIAANGAIALTGEPGTVSFMLTASNAGLADAFSIVSRTLTVTGAEDAFLAIPAGMQNIEILKGNDAKVYYSTNILARNASYAGSGTATELTFKLYEAEYVDAALQKGSLVYTETQSVLEDDSTKFFTAPNAYFVNTSTKGTYSYILEVSAQDLGSGVAYSASANICVKPLPAKAILEKPDNLYITDETHSFPVSFNIDNKTDGMNYLLTVKKNNEGEPVFSTGAPDDIGEVHAVSVGQVDEDRLFDAYTVSLKAKNEFDEAYSFDSYTFYVYNADALKIAVNGSLTDSLTMKPDHDFSKMDSFWIVNLNRKITYTDNISINKNMYQWSNIADKITWEVGDESKLTLKFNGQYIKGDSSPLLLPGAVLVLEAHENGSTYVTAAHALTGMEATLPVTAEKIEDKLYLFQTYPEMKCEASYSNGNGQEKNIETDIWGRLGLYEESGIASDVVFRPLDTHADVYDSAVLSRYVLTANQHTINNFNLYPQNIVKMPISNYKVTFELYDGETKAPFTNDVMIRGGVYINGKYRPATTINGKMGDADQTVSAVNGLYTLNFNPEEFTDSFGRLNPEDNIEYVIEAKFPGNSHYPEYIKVDNETIRKNRNSSIGVYLKEEIRSVDPSLIQNNAIIVSESVTIDGEEHPISGEFVFDTMPESAFVNIEMIIPGDYSAYAKYYIGVTDAYDNRTWGVNQATLMEKGYEFSSTVMLRGSADLTFRLRLMKPGTKTILYPMVQKGGGSNVIRLSEPIRIQSLIDISNMNTVMNTDGGPRDVYMDAWNASLGPGSFNFGGDDGQVRDTVKMLNGFWLDESSMGLEIIPTNDPLVYKAILRLAVGDYSRENPSGLFVTEGDSVSYNFMPEFSDMKTMAKGEYLKKSREEMNKSKYGYSGSYKTYGGGAYMECEIYYDIPSYQWKMLVLKSDMYLGSGITYYRTYNGWVSFVPVTARFQTGMTSEIGLKTIYDRSTGTRAFITELRPYFYTYGFGGAGFDYDFAAFKTGPYGVISHDQRYLWYNRENDARNGQKLTVSGSVGVEFVFKIGFIEFNGKYELASSERSWTYNSFNEINNAFSSGKILRMLGGRASSGTDEADENVSGTVTFDGRSYLDGADREWGTPAAMSGLRTFAALSAEPVTVLLPNAYPYSNPALTGDGKMMAYLSDMGSLDLMDTAVCFTTRDDTEEAFPEGGEIDGSDYPDSDVSVAGTEDNAVAVWTRMFNGLDADAGEEADSGDIVNMLSGMEVMAAVFDGESFTTTRLTANSTPDMVPVVAMSGNKAVAAWRSVVMGDMENPLDFSGRDDIMYSVFDGTSWSEPQVLYDGSIDHVNALNAAVLSDGTAAITYQITENDTENSEVICAVLDEDGEVKSNLRLTNNDTRDENPHITSAVFPDGIERFVLGWNALKTLDDGSVQNSIRLSALRSSGDLYPEFDREIGNASDGSDYATFRFVKGAQDIGDLSIVWNEPDLSSADSSDGIYKDAVWGIKLMKEADGTITQSGKLRLLELDDRNTADFFDAAVNPAANEISFALLLSDYSGEDEASALAIAKSCYQNKMIADEPYFSHEDILPGLDMPILFRVQNAGVEPIDEVNIELEGVSYVFDEEVIKPGENKDFTVIYTVPYPVEDPAYSITVQFETSSDSKSGVLKMDVPDVGIEQINVTREGERERSFSVLLHNNASAKLEEGRHIVRLEVSDTPDFESSIPIATETVSDPERLSMLNDGLLPLDITLSGEALEGLLDENGEIPENGAWVFFNAVLEEDGEVIEDADIGNDMDYVKVHSLLEKNGVPVSIASMTQSADGQIAVRVEALNNSMNSITNGNIIVSLKDQNGRVLATQQTYDPADSPGSFINVAGEDTCATSFRFNQTGASADVVFSRVDEDSTQLSVLRMSGVPLDFDKDVHQYDLEVRDLMKTSITAAAENPDSIVTITRNGTPVLTSQPCTLSYGANTLIITVTTGGHEVTYTVNVQNVREDNNESGGSSHIITPVSTYNARIVIEGIEQAIVIRTDAGKAVISLGALADEIFAGSENTTLTIPSIPGVNSYTLEMTAPSLAGSYGNASLTANTSLGVITIPSGMLSGMAGLDGETAGITIATGDKTNLSDDVRMAIGDKPIIQLSLSLDGVQSDWSNPDAPVTVSIPYAPTAAELADPESIIIWYIDGSGKAISVPNGHYDPATETVTFLTTHFSDYAVAYNPMSFHDVAEGAWYKKAVSFIAAREITSGTGNGSYSPDAKLTRGEFLVLMMRAYGIAPDTNPAENFSDAGNTYYTGYLAAAKRLGLSAGVGNNQYAPGKKVTRQEMFTLLYNALKVIGQLPQGDSGKTLSNFTDAGQIDAWAKDAMTLLVKAGTVGGSNGALTPLNTTTRAEMAQILYNLLGK